jgi:hypothetical protein
LGVDEARCRPSLYLKERSTVIKQYLIGVSVLFQALSVGVVLARDSVPGMALFLVASAAQAFMLAVFHRQAEKTQAQSDEIKAAHQRISVLESNVSAIAMQVRNF